tara:strand:+ start:56727 stop:57467 length:741 start_codon:yes stop_codon:yes gene_type:complete
MSDVNTKKGLSLKRMLPLIVIISVAIIGAMTLKDYLTFDALARNRETLLAWRDGNYLLAVLAFIALYIVIVAFSLPGATVMTLTGGFLFATFPGALFNVTGATIGAILIFLAAKSSLGDVLYAKIQTDDGKESILEKMEAELRENEISYLLIIRLVPAIPFFISNLAPAFLGVKLRIYALTTFFGIMPGAVVYTSIGAGLGAVFERGGTPDLGIIFEPRILGPIIGLAVLAAVPIVIKKFTKGAKA